VTRDYERRRLGDRRSRPRFEVVGELPGTLETVVRLQVRNVGLSGGLLESAVRLPAGSIQRLECDVEGMTAALDVRVCHVRAATAANGEPTYLLGIEFLTSHPLLTAVIERWLVQERDESNLSGV
jgi:hypothetical protein